MRRGYYVIADIQSPLMFGVIDNLFVTVFTGLVCIVYVVSFMRQFLLPPDRIRKRNKFEKGFIKAWKESKSDK